MKISKDLTRPILAGISEYPLKTRLREEAGVSEHPEHGDTNALYEDWMQQGLVDRRSFQPTFCFLGEGHYLT